MYKQEDYTALSSQLKRRLIWCLIPIALLLAALAASFAFRIQWLSVLLMIVTGALAIFLWDIALSPLVAYRRYLRDLLAGRKREYTGSFRGFEDRQMIREGVPCYAFLLNVGDPADEKDDRLLYWDAYLPLPDWQKGMGLWVSTFDKSVCQWQAQEQ